MTGTNTGLTHSDDQTPSSNHWLSGGARTTPSRKGVTQIGSNFVGGEHELETVQGEKGRFPKPIRVDIDVVRTEGALSFLSFSLRCTS